MLLTFKRNYPLAVPPFKAGRATNFKNKIKEGIKKTSFRVGHRWKPGHHIHFWEESPRNNGMNPEAFAIPHKFARYWGIDAKGRNMPLCAGVERFKMEFNLHNMYDGSDFFWLTIGGHAIVEMPHLKKVAQNDGLTLNEFTMWFYSEAIALQKMKMKIEGTWRPRIKTQDQPEWPEQLILQGDIVHWTNSFYVPSQTAFWNDETKKAQYPKKEGL